MSRFLCSAVLLTALVSPALAGKDWDGPQPTVQPCPASFAQKWKSWNKQGDMPQPPITCILTSNYRIYLCDAEGCKSPDPALR